MVFFLCTRPNDFHKETISKMGKFFSSILKTQNLFLNPTIPQPKDNSIMVLLYFYSSFMNILSDKNQMYQGFYLYINNDLYLLGQFHAWDNHTSIGIKLS